MATSQLSPTRRLAAFPPLAGVPVLLYHGLYQAPEARPASEKKYWLSVNQLQSQLTAIKETGLRVGRLSSLDERPANGVPEVILTFDDGRESDYRFAFPLLTAAGLPAEFFVNTALIDQPGYLRWSQLLEMQRAGLSFQSHGHDHVDLARLPAPARRDQLERSKRLLEDRLGTPVTALALPYGQSRRALVEEVFEVGYRFVCTSRCWPARAGDRVLGRVAVLAHTSGGDFRRILAKDPLWYLRQQLRSGLFYVPKRLGLSLWPHDLGVRTVEGQS